MLDRTKEPRGRRPNRCLDVVAKRWRKPLTAASEKTLPRAIGGRYGLSSKEFGPECVLAVLRGEGLSSAA